MSTQRKPGARRSPAARPAPPMVEARLVIDLAPELPVVLALCAKGGQPFTLTAGQTVLIPAGEYVAVGKWRPNWDGRIFGGFVYPTPPLSVDSAVVIPPEGGEVLVHARMDCFGLELSPGCNHYQIRGYDGAMMYLPWMRDGRCFISGAWSYPPLTLAAVPGGGRVPRSYELVSDPAQVRDGVLLVEYGTTYAFKAEAGVEEKE